MKLATEFITLNTGIEICAPADVNLMTNFVLREQGDWFEDEIHFVRAFIKEGMNVMDIGANYGLYATAMAANIGQAGHLWCFEPTPNTAQALTDTINKNNFQERTTIVEAGLSDHEGEASFYMSPNAELNSLTPDESQDMEKVTIKLKTVDQCADELNWPKIDFIKLDAEGEEVNILKGGEKFFAEHEPVVMFELKHKESINLPLIDAFEDIGYQPYYLVPGLNVLAPFDKKGAFDGFLLNLFAVKSSRIPELVAQGVVVQEADVKDTDAQDGDDSQDTALALSAKLGAEECYQSLSLKFDGIEGRSDDYGEALKAYCYARNTELPVQLRHEQLQKAALIVKKVLGGGGGEARADRLSTYARIVYDAGHRVVGNQILRFLVENYIKHSRSFGVADEPFFLPSDTLEGEKVGGNVDAWFCCAVLDQLARKQAFSSFFAGYEDTVKFVEVMSKLGFVQPDMTKRAALIRERVAKRAANT